MSVYTVEQLIRVLDGLPQSYEIAFVAADTRQVYIATDFIEWDEGVTVLLRNHQPVTAVDNRPKGQIGQ